MAERVALVTDDGETLDAELAPRPTRRTRRWCSAIRIPQYGGSMRSLVTSELFQALPPAGVTCLRFDFRGVGASTGSFGDGVGERHDVRAAPGAPRRASTRHVPTYLVGWSFGADLALSIRDEGHAGLVRDRAPAALARRHRRPPAPIRAASCVLLAEHDEFRPAGEVQAVTATWTNTETEVIGGASHFFVGRTARLVERVRGWIDDRHTS